MLAKTKIGHHTTSCFDQLTPLPHPPPPAQKQIGKFSTIFPISKKY